MEGQDVFNGVVGWIDDELQKQVIFLGDLLPILVDVRYSIDDFNDMVATLSQQDRVLQDEVFQSLFFITEQQTLGRRDLRVKMTSDGLKGVSASH